jgi:hypothetical protein
VSTSKGNGLVNQEAISSDAEGRKMLVSFSKFDASGERHQIYGEVGNRRIRSKGQIRREDPSYFKAIL